MNRLGFQEVQDPELLRAAYASAGLSCFGRALRDFRGDLYDQSFATTKIDCFWSHSASKTPRKCVEKLRFGCLEAGIPRRSRRFWC